MYFDMDLPNFKRLRKRYNFKAFRKNTKFKRYHVGITKFILNRKKYILRKKRTTFIFKSYSTFHWSKNYQIMKQLFRYYQTINLTSLSMIFPDYSYFSKISFSGYRSLKVVNFNCTAISRRVLLNNALFLKASEIMKNWLKGGSHSIYYLNNNFNILQNHFRFINSGLVIIQRSLTYPTLKVGKASNNANLDSELTFFKNSNYINKEIYKFIKILRKTLIYITLISLHLYD